VYTQVSELAQFEDACYAAHGEVRVKRQVTGFKKIKFYTLENIGSWLFSLPVSRQPRLKTLFTVSARCSKRLPPFCC
jgi:hypothetical protein